MSTFLYSTMSAQRDASPVEDPPTMKTFTDALAALVPAEVLAAHALILTFTTKSSTDPEGNATTSVTEPGVLKGSFWGLVALTIFLYVTGKWVSGQPWTTWDRFRIWIPPLAFVGWTMAQSPTAFDAAGPDWSTAVRFAAAIFGAIVLGALSAVLAKKANDTPAITASAAD